MPVLHKIYHRGNDDKKEGNYLTAIFNIKLNADTHMCCEIPTERGKTCVGFVIFSIEIVIKSPDGKGNGNKLAAVWANAYGVELFGSFFKFDNTQPKGGEKESWKISKTIPLLPIPCPGGLQKGKITIRIAEEKSTEKMAGDKEALKNYSGEAYSIEYEMKVTWCGKTSMDFKLKQGDKAFALDGGDPDMEVRKRALKEVKKGDKPPFGLKTTFPPTADMEVTETGEITTKK